MSRLRKVLAASLVSALMLGIVAFPAAASDHVFNAAFSQGADDRGFANPVTGNPGNAQADLTQCPVRATRTLGSSGVHPPSIFPWLVTRTISLGY